MKKIVLMIVFSLSINVRADDISHYRYYETNRSESYLVYLKKNDPCIHAGYIKENDMYRYCEMGDSGINLEESAPSAYATEFTFNGVSVNFIMAAPWNEQKCRIDLDENSIFCEPTGR
jgi:hypothetical protein